MKNYRLPDNDEWDKIVDEAFSSDEIHTFSEKYNLKKYQDYPIRKGITMKKNNLLMNLTVVATALAVVAVPTGVYIAGNMTSTKSSTQYANEEQAKNEPASPVANDKIYDVEYGWLPEGFERNDDASYTYFTNTDNDKIFMITSFVKNLSGEKTENGKALTVRDEYDTDDKTIDIRYQDNYVENSTDKDCTNYGRVATVYFKDTPYELEVFITDDITKDDFKKILENIRLIESDTETAEIYTGEQVTETEMTITDGNDDGQINEGIHQFTEDDIDYDTIYNVEYGWLPKGLEYQNEDSPYGGKFHNWTTGDGMTPNFSKVQKGAKYYEDTGNPEIETTKDEWLLDGKTVSMYHRSTYNPDNPELNYGRIAFIYFDNTPYVLKLYVTDGISEEDFGKIIDNVKLVPSKEETAFIDTGDDVDTLQEYRSGSTENTDDKIYTLEYSWLPEGLEYHKSGPYGGKFHNDNNDRSGMTPSFVKNISGEEIENESGFTVLDEYTTDDKVIEISYRSNYEENADNYNYGRIARVYFKNTPYELSLWVTDDITKDDLKKIIANVKLVPTKFETASIYPPEESESEPEEYTSSVNADDCTVYHIGDEISEPNPDKKGNISVKVNSVRFQDNLDGLDINRHRLTIDPNKYLDENGKIVDRKMDWFNEDFEVEDTISIPCHVMVVNLTYTNHDDETIDYMVGPQINHKFDGVFDNENPMWIEEQEKNTVYASLGYDLEQCDLFGDFTYFSISSEKFGEFDDVIIEPNESAEVQLAFIIRDDMRDNLYLNINGYLENNSTNLVDLSNLK